MTNLINGVKCNNREATFIHTCLFNNFKRNGDSGQDASYVQHLKEVCNECTYFLSMVEVDNTVTDVCFTVNGNTVNVETQWTDSTTRECMGNAPVRKMNIADARVYYKQHLTKGFTVPSDDCADDEYNALMNAESADLDAMDRYAEQESDITGFTDDLHAIHHEYRINNL